MTKPTVTLAGDTVTVSYIADPALGHGQFQLSNESAAPMTAVVREASIELDGQSRSLPQVTVFDLSTDQSLNAAGFDVGPHTTFRFLLGFPAIPYHPQAGATPKVTVRLTIGETELSATSPIHLVQRIPRDK